MEWHPGEKRSYNPGLQQGAESCRAAVWEGAGHQVEKVGHPLTCF